MTSLVARAGAGRGWTATSSAWACAARSRRAPTSSSRSACSRRGARCRSGWRTSADLSRLVEPFDPGALQHQRQPGREPAVRLAGRPVLRSGADRRPALRARDPARRPGCCDELLEVGFRLAQTMVELFADLPPDHEYFRQFSFIAPEDLPIYRSLLARADPARLEQLSAEDQRLLLAPTFKLIPARHRLGLITPELMDKVLAARRYFREHLPARATPMRSRSSIPTQLQRGDHDPGKRDLRQDRLRPGAGAAEDRRADHRAAGTAGAAHRGDGGGARLARSASAAAGCRWRSGRSSASPAPS